MTDQDPNTPEHAQTWPTYAAPPGQAHAPTSTGGPWGPGAQAGLGASPTAPARRRDFDAQAALRVSVVAGSLLVLTVGLLMALVSVNAVIETWFEYQWVPVARLVMGIVLCLAAVGTLLLLRRRKP